MMVSSSKIFEALLFRELPDFSGTSANPVEDELPAVDFVISSDFAQLPNFSGTSANPVELPAVDFVISSDFAPLISSISSLAKVGGPGGGGGHRPSRFQRAHLRGILLEFGQSMLLHRPSRKIPHGQLWHFCDIPELLGGTGGTAGDSRCLSQNGYESL